MDEGQTGVLPMRSRDCAPPPQDAYALDSSVGHLLRRAHQRYQAVFQDCAAGLGLTGPQFAALLRIAERGRVTQNLLGRLAAMDPATVQGVVRRLEARGLVQSMRDPLDRRARVLRITPHGAQMVSVAAEAGRRANEALLAPLSPADRLLLIELLRRLAGANG
ncbi:MAG: MarR family winged helix-turn-helix transcriptional regulator [Roseococcus sp.]|nr:MarR family winged helix-turn-helix transcriptional regulator [Roseococcus sp.]